MGQKNRQKVAKNAKLAKSRQNGIKRQSGASACGAGPKGQRRRRAVGAGPKGPRRRRLAQGPKGPELVVFIFGHFSWINLLHYQPKLFFGSFS